MPNLSDSGPIKIAFVGRAKAGRTFCSEYLRTDYKFVRKSLSEPIERFIKTMYFYDKRKRTTWETRRSFYDAIYKTDNTILIEYLAGRVNMATADIVVDDARYMNEAIRLKELGFIIVRVTRPKGKETHLSKSLGKTYSPGTLLLHEMYSKDFTKALGVDYSVHNETREATRKALDAIIDDILTNRTRNT